jgi:hypothetical protein
MKLTSNAAYAAADGVKRAREKDAMGAEDGAAGQEEQEQMDNPMVANTATDQDLDGDAT